jgi:integrase/recombinase XerD
MPHPTDDTPTIDRCTREFFTDLAIRDPAAATVSAYHSDLNQILHRALGEASSIDTPVTVLDLATMREAFADFAKTHKRASIARAHLTMRLFFDFLVSAEIVPGSPMPGIKIAKVKKREPKPFAGWHEDFSERLLTACAAGKRKGYGEPWPERDVAVCATLLLTGVRSSEFCSLTISSMEGYTDGQVFRVLGKGDKWRSIPVEGDIDPLLSAYLESRKHRFPKVKVKRTSPLFLGIRSDGETAITRDQLRNLLWSCLVGAELSTRKPVGALAHAFRHTYGTMLAADGAGIHAIAKMMGHESIATTQSYLQSLAADEREAAKRNRTYRVLADLQSTSSDDGASLQSAEAQ